MTKAYHYQIRDGHLLESLTGGSHSNEKVTPSPGIYYVVPMGRGWQVMAYRYADVAEELDHAKFWEWHVSLRLAGHWAAKVARPHYKLVESLKEHPYAFPRGRIVRLCAACRVYHGADLPKGSGVTRGLIETIFGVKGNAKWVEDDHEHCLLADKLAVRELLKLEEDWAFD